MFHSSKYLSISPTPGLQELLASQIYWACSRPIPSKYLVRTEIQTKPTHLNVHSSVSRRWPFSLISENSHPVDIGWCHWWKYLCEDLVGNMLKVTVHQPK